MGFRRVFDRLLVAFVILASWKIASALVGSLWLGSPEATAQRLWTLLLGGELARHTAYTVQAAIFGFVIGGLPGLALPFALRRSPTITAIVEPFLVAGYGLPKLALVPMLVILFGIGINSKIALVALVTFFLVYFNTVAGIRSVDERLVAAGRVFGASERQIALHVVWPAAVPYIFAGFRISLPYAVGGAAVAELVSSNRGLGFLIQSGAMDFDTAASLAAVVALSVVVFAASAVVDALEKLLLRWRPPALDNPLLKSES